MVSSIKSGGKLRFPPNQPVLSRVVNEGSGWLVKEAFIDTIQKYLKGAVKDSDEGRAAALFFAFT